LQLDGSLSYSAELFKFSTVSMEWTDLSAAAVVKGSPPSGRLDHTMTAVGTEIYVFGGWTGSGEAEGGRGHKQS